MVVPVRDLELARRWYEEKLGLRKFEVEVDEPERQIVLGFSADDCGVCLFVAKPEEAATRAEGSVTGSVPVFFSDKLDKAHQMLVSRGIDAGPIKSDPGGTRFFEFRDLEGNILEVCEEH